MHFMKEKLKTFVTSEFYDKHNIFLHISRNLENFTQNNTEILQKFSTFIFFLFEDFLLEISHNMNFLKFSLYWKVFEFFLFQVTFIFLCNQSSFLQTKFLCILIKNIIFSMQGKFSAKYIYFFNAYSGCLLISDC